MIRLKAALALLAVLAVSALAVAGTGAQHHHSGGPVRLALKAAPSM